MACPHPTALHAAMLAVAMLAAGDACAARVVVLTSADTPPYRQAIAGARTLGLPVAAARAASLDQSAAAALIGNGGDVALVTFGSSAAHAAARLEPSLPAVNCMTLGHGGAHPAATRVVPFTVPEEAQLESLRRLLPRARNVGILFDPAQGEQRAQVMAGALQRAGYAALLEPVTGPTSLPGALSRLAGVDVLLALRDPVVYAPEHARALMLFSYRRRIPLVGPTEAWVKAGALYAVDWDYADLGRHCAELALQGLGGTRAGPPAPPRLRVVGNGRTAEQLGVAWDAATASAFDRMYP